MPCIQKQKTTWIQQSLAISCNAIRLQQSEPCNAKHNKTTYVDLAKPSNAKRNSYLHADQKMHSCRLEERVQETESCERDHPSVIRAFGDGEIHYERGPNMRKFAFRVSTGCAIDEPIFASQLFQDLPIPPMWSDTYWIALAFPLHIAAIIRMKRRIFQKNRPRNVFPEWFCREKMDQLP